MKRLQQNPDQLTLSLSFTEPTPAVLRNIATLMEIATASHIGGTPGVVTPHPDGRDGDQNNHDALGGQTTYRHTLRRLAGCVSIATKREWHEVWVLAYHEFFKRTGVHPVTESIRANMKTHLDYVFTDATWPGILHNVLDEMLTKEAA